MRTIISVIFGLSLFFVSCSNQQTTDKTNENNTAQHEASTDSGQAVTTVQDTSAIVGQYYYCPMKCEGDKRYHEPGKCPVCGMDLEKAETASNEKR